ncbi:hypothetical protein COO91_04285 [Nostoc flagelliforme CCNUN1]|uniref:Uncharacterized protein n=1 Tax=Nostoc flagelliforme CCNUN1 TaxID=2038116 RepID=A0A2K8SSJ5_9NOSO|nr:hypothetical protein [Nostoc flagelliforme]AUB38320.1 hypothetical protein COO91_04285 [Nostoc flagelliforme CCNUN1]
MRLPLPLPFERSLEILHNGIISITAILWWTFYHLKAATYSLNHNFSEP